MHRFSPILCVFCLILFPALLTAEEQVTLKSGARLIGSVTLEGQTVHVKIGDAQLHVTLSDVDTIGPVGTESKLSPERLLMIALEARAQQGTSAGLVGLLAEAYRQAPEDARIAYWYAQSLVDAGLGSAAQGVLQKHRTAIEAELPGLTQRLAKQIQERVELEHLPDRLAARVDQLNSEAKSNAFREDDLPMYVRFRLTDSTGQPVEKSAIRMECNGSEERLEPFDAGYYLFSFESYRNNDDPNCQLIVNSPGLEPKQFALQPAADHVANAGNLVVKRYADDDKAPVTIVVADQSGESVQGASVTLRPQDGGDESGVQTASTDADGRVAFKAFPMNYTYTVTAKGFKPENGRVELKRDSEQPEPTRVKLYPAMAATIRFAWSTTSLQGDGGTTSNETTIELGEGVPPMPYSPDTMHLLRPVQVGDKLTLQSGPPFFGGAMAAALAPWVRQVPSELLKDSPFDYFSQIDLKKLDEMKSEWQEVQMSREAPRRGPYQPLSFEIQEGEVYAGQVPGRDMRNGQPTLVSFKAFVEMVSTADESE
jgi:hypothetical protein